MGRSFYGLRTRLRPHWHRVLERSPRLYTYNLRKRQPRTPAVTADADLVLVGYPACANTFARIAFLHANPGLHVASHAHSWTQVAEAARHRLPTIILVRDPVEAVTSVLVRFPERNVHQELVAFARLYRRSARYLDRVVVADFEEVTTVFGEVIERVNRRFGTSFNPFVHGDESAIAEVLGQIEAYDRTQFGEATNMRTARPSAEKEDEKARIRPILASPELQPLVEDCERVYRCLRQRAGLSASG